jgi:4-hydroxy-3-polyprenylbenzoate decarboxylase
VRAAIGVRLLELLQDTEIETHLVLSKAVQITLARELDRRISEIHALADFVHSVNDIGASISSESFRTLGMIVAPCSMRTLAEIANGTSSTWRATLSDRLIITPKLMSGPPFVGMSREWAAHHLVNSSACNPTQPGRPRSSPC